LISNLIAGTLVVTIILLIKQFSHATKYGIFTQMKISAGLIVAQKLSLLFLPLVAKEIAEENDK